MTIPAVGDGYQVGDGNANETVNLGTSSQTINFPGTLTIGSTTVSATAAEINRAADVSARVVATTAATLTVTATEHGSRTIVLGSTHTQTITLPQATGSGERYKFAVSVVGTDGSKVITVANATDVMAGFSVVNSTSTDQASSFLTSETSDTVTFNNTTTGGIVGTTVIIEDIATGVFLVNCEACVSGIPATPFSAAVS